MEQVNQDVTHSSDLTLVGCPIPLTPDRIPSSLSRSKGLDRIKVRLLRTTGMASHVTMARRPEPV